MDLKEQTKTNLSHSSHDQQRTCKALFPCQIFFLATLLRHEVLLVSMKWGVVLQVKKHSPEVQNQFYGIISDWCLSNLLWEEKLWNREPLVFTGNWFWFFIVFLLSDLLLLLLQRKLICFDLIPGGCREQCVIFMPLATFSIWWQIWNKTKQTSFKWLYIRFYKR